MYKHPDLHSQVVDTIETVSRIPSSEIFKTSQKLKIGENFELVGSFIKVTRNKTMGFVYSSDLSTIKPIIINDENDVTQISLLGEIIKKEEIKKPKIYNYKEYLVDEKIIEYQNAIYIYSSFDGCFDHVYKTRNLKLNEVYHQMLNHYVFNGQSILIPKYLKKQGNSIHFQSEGLIENLKIEIIDNKSFVISSYDCT